MTKQTSIQTVETGQVQPHVESQPLPADPMVSMIERIALDPNADLDKLERMLAMKERLDEQNAKVAFAHALSVARANMPPILKDATVDFTSQKGRTHYKHETLAGIAKAIDPILSENGLSYRFRTNQNDGRVLVTCIVSHRDGYSEETSLSASPDQSGNKNNFQAVGSAVTYLQRYTLKAALGLSAEVDDDAQGAGNNQDAPKFNAEAAAGRIKVKINRANSLDELSNTWIEESDTIKRVKAEAPQEFERLERAKDKRKSQLSDEPKNQSNDLVDEIPY